MSLYAVSRDSGEALYVQIARQIEQEIGNLYSPGDGLPPEAELALRFGVNRHTLRRAIDELIDAGMLERRHGRGVFVTDTLLDYQLGAGTRFTETLNAHGLSTDSRVLRNQIIPANERVAQRLGLHLAEPVLWLETLRIADERPFCVSSHFIPSACFPDLGAQYQGGSLHHFLLATYGCKLRRTESLVTAVLPQGDDARLLGMPQNRPVLRVKSLNVDTRDGTTVEYVITRFRADRIQLCINP
jgi:GntR family phosphonate transport system transcriptional regulator